MGISSYFRKGKALNPLRFKASEMAPPVGLETNDPFGQKHSRLARLERFATLVVSSCSEHRFICRRQRGAPSQLTAGAAVCDRGAVRILSCFPINLSNTKNFLGASLVQLRIAKVKTTFCLCENSTYIICHFLLLCCSLRCNIITCRCWCRCQSVIC